MQRVQARCVGLSVYRSSWLFLQPTLTPGPQEPLGYRRCWFVQPFVL